MAAKKKAVKKVVPRRARVAAGITCNQVMLYVADAARSLACYRDALGFLVVDEFSGAYARLRATHLRGDR